jgi:hypothetical protein
MADSPFSLPRKLADRYGFEKNKIRTFEPEWRKTPSGGA